MSAPPLPPEPNPALLPVLAGVVYLAAIVAVWGVVSLVTNRDVIDYPDAGPLLGPAMALAAALVTWLITWRVATVLAPVIALFASYVAMIAVATIGYAVTTGILAGMPQTAVHFAISPFVVAAALLAPLVVVATRALRGRSR